MSTMECGVTAGAGESSANIEDGRVRSRSHAVVTDTNPSTTAGQPESPLTTPNPPEINTTYIQSRANVSHICSVVQRLAQSIVFRHKNGPFEEDSLNNEDEENEDSDESSNYRDGGDSGNLKEWTMDIDTYERLRPRLPQWIDDYKVIIDLQQGFLNIRVVPGDLHASAAGAYTFAFEAWSSNYQPPPIGSLPPLRNRTDANYRYAARGSKSPELCFIPRDITSPPARLKPGTNIPYPTVIIEVAHKHESWRKLKRDAREKAFSAATSIQLFVGIKLYTQRYQMFWGKRSPTGRGMHIEDTTPKLDALTPSNLVFTLPKNLIFWGVPLLNWPPTPTPDLELRIDTLRLAIADLW